MCRPLRPSATSVTRASPSTAAWVGGKPPGIRVGLWWRGPSAVFKRVIGDPLPSRTDQRRRTETVIAVDVLNRTLELGRLKSVRTV
jgi:hypothetical protein